MWTPREHGVPTPGPEGWAKSRPCRRRQPCVWRRSCRHSVAQPALLNQYGPRTASQSAAALRTTRHAGSDPLQSLAVRESGRSPCKLHTRCRPNPDSMNLLSTQSSSPSQSALELQLVLTSPAALHRLLTQRRLSAHPTLRSHESPIPRYDGRASGLDAGAVELGAAPIALFVAPVDRDS